MFSKLAPPRCAGAPLSSDKRKAYFAAKRNRTGRVFDTDLVWTFHFYQHLVDIGKYELNMVHKFDLARWAQLSHSEQQDSHANHHVVLSVINWPYRDSRWSRERSC